MTEPSQRREATERGRALVTGAVVGGAAVGWWLWTGRQRVVASARALGEKYRSEQEAVGRLRELDQLKTVFLSTASHELRTPATAIAGFASLLSESWDRFDDAQRRDFVRRIAANATSLSAIVQDLLDFSLLDSGATTVVLEDVDLGSAVDAVLHRIGPTLSSHDLVAEVEPAALVSAEVQGVDRIITNLLTNAAKFAPEGTRITIGVAANGHSSVQLSVSDEGPGVPPAERELIFKRFYRGEGEAVLQTRGVGIGLSVVAELVDRVGGAVGVEDAPGGGARFVVSLPVAKVANA